MMVKSSLFKLVVLLLPFFATAQRDLFSFGAGTNGFGVGYQRMIGKRLSTGFSANYLNVNANLQFQALDQIITNNLKIQSNQLEGYVSWFPRMRKKSHPKSIKTPFFLKAGLAFRTDPTYFGKTTLRDIPTIGSFQLSDEDLGFVYSTVVTSRIQPMLSLGYKPLNRKKIYLQLETGGYYHGRPELTMDATGLLNANDVNEPAVQKVLAKYRMYPLFRLEMGFRL